MNAPQPSTRASLCRCALALALGHALAVHAQEPRDLLFERLRVHGAAAARDPGDAKAAQAVAGILGELGGFHGAARAAGGASLQLRAGEAAEWVRWGKSIPPDSAATRFARTDQALAMLDALIDEARAAGDRDVLVRLEGDRAVALHDRERWSDCLDQLAALEGEGIALRPYLREARADALLALRRPEEARAIYAALVAADSTNRNALLGRFYAEVECEDFAAALATADTIDDPVLAAQARHYAGLDAEAWERMEPLARSAPAAAYVRAAAASIEASRGWPRRAHEDLLVASALFPQDVGIAVGLAESHMRRRELDAARPIESRLAAEDPGNVAVARLTRELEEFDSARWEFDVRGRQESGTASAAPGPGVEATGRVWSAPFRDAFRGFVGAGDATARTPEGDALRHRVGAGIEWRGRDAEALASAWSNGGDVSKTGAALSGAWSPDDYWNVSADYERYAWETPLRAVLHGITADGGGVGVGYAWNESRALWAGLRAHEFSDGNQRRQLRFAWAERVLEQPGLSVTLRPEIYRSRNSLTNAPYFNPSSDLSLSLAADVQDVLWRRYEDSFRHRLVARAGRYRQEGFDDGWVGGVGYEQAWQRARFELRWGLDLGRARYDGANERYVIVFLTGSGRF